MLTLTRNVGETIIIDGNIHVTVTEVRGNTVRLSIDAPREIRILREEVHQRILLAEQIAAAVAANSDTALAAATNHSPDTVVATEAETAPTGVSPGAQETPSLTV